MGLLGLGAHYGLAYQLSPLFKTDPNPQYHMDVLTVGFGGGVLGGLMERYWTAAPAWYHPLIFSVMGVLVFDYFLFEV